MWHKSKTSGPCPVKSDLLAYLASVFASSTDLQRIQTPRSCLFWDFRIEFRADTTTKTCWSGCRVQVLVHVLSGRRAPAWHLAKCGTHFIRLFQRVIEDFDFKINGWALREALWHSSWWYRQAQAQVCSSNCRQQQPHFSKTCCNACDTAWDLVWGSRTICCNACDTVWDLVWGSKRFDSL